jgi:putative redox protein
MVKSEAVYTGDKHCELAHGPSGSKIETDAPKDNLGKGERFSPTDLVGAALASCILTTMAIVVERDGLSMVGSTAEVEKEMTDKPRKIGSLKLLIKLPKSWSPEQRKKYEAFAKSCPVHQSLHPEVKISLAYQYSV